MRNTSVNPLDAVFKMITRWDAGRVVSVLELDTKHYTIRNEWLKKRIAGAVDRRREQEKALYWW